MTIRDPLSVTHAYKTTVLAKDIDALMALYDENVRIFDLWAGWAFNSAEAWRTAMAHWFSSLGTERVVVELDEVQTTVTDNLAVIHAFITYKSVSAEGQDLRAQENRVTWVVEQKNNTWKIVHEHSSAPVDFESMKVILKR